MDDNMKKLSENLKQLGESVKEISDAISTCTDGLGEFITSMGQIVGSIPDVRESLGGIKEKVKEFYREVGESGPVQNFADSVTHSAARIGLAMHDLTKSSKETQKVFEELFSRSSKNFGNLTQGVKKLAQNTKMSFEKLKDTISNFTFSNLKSAILDLPGTLKSAVGKMGNALFTGSEKIGAMAGKLLTGGLIGGIAVAASALIALVAAFRHLMESNEEFREKIEEAWSKVTEAMEPVIESFNRLKETLFGEDSGETPPLVEAILNGTLSLIETVADAAEVIAGIVSGVLDAMTEFWIAHGEKISDTISTVVETISGFIGGLVDVVSGIIDVIVGFFTGDGNRISAGVNEMWDGITTAFSSGWKLIQKAFSGAVSFFKGIWKGISSAFSSVKSFFGKQFTSAYSSVKSAFSGIIDFFSGIWNKIKKLFTGIGVTIGNGISGAFKAAVNGVISFAQKVINGFISSINGAIRTINKLPGVSIGVISTVSLPRLAAGGLVDAGQLFVAREAGPELVGTFNGRTAVMNNNQIVDSVSRGVYQAVKAAMSGGDGSYTFNIVNKLDGREIGRQVINYHNGVVRQTGSSPLMI